jgi:integrase
MPRATLTDITLKSLSTPEKGQVVYWDAKLPGFGCRVSQGGQKTFVVMYGPRSSRRRKVVGKYPLQSLKEARDAARKVLASITLGVVDPPSRNITFNEARDQFLTETRQRNRARTAKDYERLLTRHFRFGSRKLSATSKDDLKRCLDKLHDTPSELSHAYTIMRIFFNWAYREELIESNPADRINKPVRTISRDRVLDDVELSSVLTLALYHPWPFGPIVALCILTGQRRSEIGMLEWDWIDQSQRLISFPADRVKNGRAHVIPFGNMTASVLETIPQIDQYLFSGRNTHNAIFNGWAKSKRGFDAKLEGVSHYTLHDLRRTFSTVHAKLGTPIQVTEKLLNHVSGTVSGVAAIYNRHSYMEEMRGAVLNYEAAMILQIGHE